METSFSSLLANRFSRKFGGTKTGVADPYINGYHFIYFSQLPDALPEYATKVNPQLSQKKDIIDILSAACTGVTPPGGTLSKVEMPGLGGLKWAVPGTVDYANSVTIKFLEFSKTPILDIMHSWVSMIRDYRTGVASPKATSKAGYSGSFFYWTTAPDGVTVETYAMFDGVFPLKDPFDLFGSDIETQARVDVEIEFHTDYMWREQWVKNKCEAYAKDFANAISTIDAYGEKNY